ALGRKNYLFCGNHDAAVRAAIVYSLVDTCKALDVDPRLWLEDVLLRIPGNEDNRAALRNLLPDRWKGPTLSKLEKLEINCTSRL
ncbi:MAG: transposase domain-containing protein, partial [Bacteroidales bacterium]|nr:transposase domain-containing protein [Bacteroidales bacterium]